MKIKILVVTLIVVLALGGTLVFAAIDEDGRLVNPFVNILSGKVEDGTITREEADVFTKVWEAIKGEENRGFRGMKAQGERSELIEEIINGKVEEGTLTREEADAILEGDGRFGKRMFSGVLCDDEDFEGCPWIKGHMGRFRKSLLQENEEPET